MNNVVFIRERSDQRGINVFLVLITKEESKELDKYDFQKNKHNSLQLPKGRTILLRHYKGHTTFAELTTKWAKYGPIIENLIDVPEKQRGESRPVRSNVKKSEKFPNTIGKDDVYLTTEVPIGLAWIYNAIDRDVNDRFNKPIDGIIILHVPHVDRPFYA